MSDSPRIASTDQLTMRIRHVALFQRVRSRTLATLLRDAVHRMNASGDDAESHYQGALSALRQAGAEAIGGLAQELRARDPYDCVNRWALVQLLTDLRDARALRVLESIVASSLPAERSPDPHGSTVARELVVRTTAVEGIARLAIAGSSEASAALLKLATHSVRSVRIAAVLACVEQGGERAREELQRRMPESDHWMLDIRRVHPREAPPIQGHRFLPPKSPPEGTAVPRPSSESERTPLATQRSADQPSGPETISRAPRPRRRAVDSRSKRSSGRKPKKG